MDNSKNIIILFFTNFGVYSISITRVIAENKMETIILNPLDLNSDARQLLGEKASDYILAGISVLWQRQTKVIFPGFNLPKCFSFD